VVAFQQQLVPLVEKREIIQQHVRQSEQQLQEAQMRLRNDQQALQDTEAAIQYRLNVIAQLTGQPAPPPMLSRDFPPQYPSSAFEAQRNLGPQPVTIRNNTSENMYIGEVPNIGGDPNIPSWITSVPAPQNQRYASGYVPSGPDNPRSESAVDVRQDPATREVMVAMAKARAAV